MSLKEELIELRLSTGMNKAQFARYFGIPYRTYQEWELGWKKSAGVSAASDGV